jgi:hypothetical protein
LAPLIAVSLFLKLLLSGWRYGTSSPLFWAITNAIEKLVFDSREYYLFTCEKK